jgi:mono/diheme cytochrome c family protein
MNRTQLEITLGIFLILATGSILILYGIREDSRMKAFNQSQQAQAIEVGAELFEAQCSRCHGTQGKGILGLCPPLNDRYFFDQRLKDVGWSGTQEDYIIATASGGRLTSTRPDQYPGNGTPPVMPPFSQRFGGPLRDDQIQSIAAFIMNWEPTAKEVSNAPAPAGPTVGTDITQQLPQGDAKAGEALTQSLGCVGCHVTGTTGPAWMPSAKQPGIGERAATRITQPDYTGKATTPEQYLLESIVDPSAFVVNGYPDKVMPGIFATTLTSQDAANIIAYLLTLK